MSNDYFDYEDDFGADGPRGADLASMNLEAQVRLVDDLRGARDRAGLSVHDVADSLGVEESVVQAIDSHERSLTLRELRLLAHASDAFVSYVVTPRISRALEATPFDGLDRLVGELWSPVEDEPLEDAAERLLVSASA